MANKQNMHVTVPADVLKKVKEIAAKDQRTLSGMVSVLLSEAVKQHDKKAKSIEV